MPEDHHRHASVVDTHESVRPATVRARHAATLLVWRQTGGSTEILMGMRGAKHRFMPNRLVFPGGAVDRADLSAPAGSPLHPHTEWALNRGANARLAHGLAIAAARELHEETGLTMGHPPKLDGLRYLARAITPPGLPIRFNARFLCIHQDHVSGTIGGDGELDNLRFYDMAEALALDLATPTRKVLEQMKLFLAMTPEQRDSRQHVPVLKKDRGWVME